MRLVRHNPVLQGYFSNSEFKTFDLKLLCVCTLQSRIAAFSRVVLNRVCPKKTGCAIKQYDIDKRK